MRTIRAQGGKLFGFLAGIASLIITLLLISLVIGRILGLNIVFIPEATRIVFIWGVAMGTISVSCFREHFQVELFGREDINSATYFSIFRTIVAISVLAYVLVGGYPTIAGAAMQQFASLPFSYSLMRTAVITCVGGMLITELIFLIEQVLIKYSPLKMHEVTMK
ncbi:MAG: hypothetical protein ACKVOY_21185 [Burkholderiaceae bacterium]